MAPATSSASKGKQKAFRIEPTAEWYNIAPALEPPAKSTKPPNAAQLSDAQTRATTLHTDMLTAHTDITKDSSSDGAFLQKVLQGGTLSDRLSALTLLVQASPLHNMKALDALKSMAERGRGGGRDQSLKALRCIVDWWTGGGAPTRKLKYFRDQPLSHPNVTDRHLVMWYFEDWLKKYFFSALQILETLSLDPLQYVRMQAVTFIYNLLRERPEQEQNLLRLLVNNLGDTERTVCSRVSHYLLQLLQAHPSMKGIVVREMTSLVFRASTSTAATAPGAKGTHIRFDDAAPSQSTPKSKPKDKAKTKADDTKPGAHGNPHAAYYATITFNQIVLSPSPADRAVARQLVDIYFTFFRELLGEGSIAAELDEEKVPVIDGNDNLDDGKKGGKGKAKGKGRASQSGEGGAFAEVEDSNSRHISAILTGVNRALPFAKLTMNDAGFGKHIDTLFLITHTSTFNISLQALLLLQQISTSLKGDPSATGIADRYYRALYTSLHDPRLASSAKQAMYLNLVFKAVKADSSLERAAAFVRRFLQVLVAGGGGGPEFTAGGLYLMGEVFSTVKGLRQLVTTPEKKLSAEKEGPYDPRKREPLHAHATVLPLWELTPLLHHYHPAVALHARQLLSSQPVTAAPDLSLNTLGHFLDRFVYKNPKQPRPKGASVMQPAASRVDGTGGVKLVRGEVADAGGLMNDPAFTRRKAEDVPVDQLFFHKYFAKKREHDQQSKHGAADEDAESSADEEAGPEDAEDVEADSDAMEEKIWEAMKSTMPKAEGDNDLLLDDSEDGGFDLDDSEDGEANLDDVGSDAASVSEAPESDAEPMSDMGDDEDGDLELAEGSDAEDLLDLDADVPVGLIEFDGSDAQSDEEEWSGVASAPSANKRKRGVDDRRENRKKLRALPTFASAEDYAKLIDEGPEDNI